MKAATGAFTIENLSKALELSRSDYQTVFERRGQDSWLGKELQQIFGFVEKAWAYEQSEPRDPFATW